MSFKYKYTIGALLTTIIFRRFSELPIECFFDFNDLLNVFV